LLVPRIRCVSSGLRSNPMASSRPSRRHFIVLFGVQFRTLVILAARAQLDAASERFCLPQWGTGKVQRAAFPTAVSVAASTACIRVSEVCLRREAVLLSLPYSSAACCFVSSSLRRPDGDAAKFSYCPNKQLDTESLLLVAFWRAQLMKCTSTSFSCTSL